MHYKASSSKLRLSAEASNSKIHQSEDNKVHPSAEGVQPVAEVRVSVAAAAEVKSSKYSEAQTGGHITAAVTASCSDNCTLPLWKINVVLQQLSFVCSKKINFCSESQMINVALLK
jgi:hypothetical protein